MGLGRTLIHRARKLITGANVHRLKTWIFCYEHSVEGSETRLRYEQLLRTFVAAEHSKCAAPTRGDDPR
jgi:hypothetical protein